MRHAYLCSGVAVGAQMSRYESPAFRPAFLLTERVRINDDVHLHAKQSGEVIEILSGDQYRVDLGYARLVFARKELTAAKA